MSASAKWPRSIGVTLRTLRFYEDKGLIDPKRDGSTRLYSRRDNARLKLILLGRKVGFSLRDVKQIMDLYDPSGTNTKQLRLTLDKSEKQLAACRSSAPSIDEAIGELTNMMTIVRAMLAERTARPKAAAGQAELDIRRHAAVGIVWRWRDFARAGARDAVAALHFASRRNIDVYANVNIC